MESQLLRLIVQMSTRLISLLAPVQSITISIYGYHASGPSRIVSPPLLPEQPIATPVVLSRSEEQYAKENLDWVSAWAGGVDGLMDILEGKVEDEVKVRALGCLELLADRDPEGIRSKLVHRNIAMRYLLTQQPGSDLTQRILADPTYATHPATRAAIPIEHRYYTLLSSGIPDSDRLRAAWQEIGGKDHTKQRIALVVLRELLSDTSNETLGLDAWLHVPGGMDTSNLARLLDLAKRYTGSAYPNGEGDLHVVLDLLDSCIATCNLALPEGPQSRIILSQLACSLPRLVPIFNLRSKSNRRITLPTGYASEIVKQLFFCSTEVIDSTLAYDACKAMASSFLLHISCNSPYSFAFTPNPTPIIVPSHAFTAQVDDSDSRRLLRLSYAISPTPTSSALVHTVTPSELVQLLAPTLHALLSTAPQPLLGIASTLANPTPESQASAWAGKVYTSNEFRERGEEARVGLGIRGMSRDGSNTSHGGNTGVGGRLSPAYGVSGGSGGGLGPGRISRPASRHVDEYVR